MAGNANPRIQEAISFAVEAHGKVGQARKDTTFPYVVHPIRVAEILYAFGYGEDVVAAGCLHDTIEDAGVTVEELRTRFGDRVASLVTAASEPDRSPDWQERKEHTIESLRTETDRDVLGLVAADKLDNVRSIAETLKTIGPARTWTIFNAGKDKQRWYYRTLAATLLARRPGEALLEQLDGETRAVFSDA